MVLQSQPMDRSTPPSLSSTSSDEAVPSSKSRRRGSRTLVACEACKKRKTKCSGRPAPCETCHKLDTFCHFNSKLDARRKTAYKPIALHEKKEYIFNGILKTLKFSDTKDVSHLIETIRSNASPQQIATCLKQNLQQLQDKSLIPALDIDENDIVSLGLQGLFSHRGKRATFISKDQKSYPTLTHRSDTVKLSGSDAKASRAEVDNEQRFGHQHYHASPESTDEISPVTNESSTSFHRGDDGVSVTSASMSSQRHVNELARGQTTPRFLTKAGTKRKSFKDRSMVLESNAKRGDHPADSHPETNYNAATVDAVSYSYLHDRRYDQTTPTDRFYMQMDHSAYASSEERLAAERVQHFKQMSKDTLSTGNMPQHGWYPPHWNRETIDPTTMGGNHSLHLQDSMFVDNMFHSDQPLYNQPSGITYT